MTTSYIPFTQLRTLLLSCGYFHDFRDLRGFFSSHDELTNMWQSDFYDLEDMEKQIDQIIDSLLNQKSRRTEENGLLLFLRVLSERIQWHEDGKVYYTDIMALLAQIKEIIGGGRQYNQESQESVASPVAMPSESLYDTGYATYGYLPTISHNYTAPQPSLQTATYPVTNAPVQSYYEPEPETELPIAPHILPMESPFALKDDWQQYRSAMASVVVPQVINGQIRQKPSGLGWLITPTLLLTGWRLARAKSLLQPCDLLASMANSYVLFNQIEPALSDYSSPTSKYRVQRLEYYNPSLDYMLLRLKDRQDSSLRERGFFRVDDDGWLTTESELLLIQYPKVQNKATVPVTYLKGNKKSKRIVYRADKASSVYGAPLFDVNRSVVVALHNGKNRPPRPYTGSLLSVILEDLAEHKRGLYQEIRTVR